MKVRVTAILAVLALLVGAIPALAQVQTGEITGRVSDDTGAVLQRLDLLPKDVAATKRAGDKQQRRTAIARLHVSPFAAADGDPLFGMGLREAVTVCDQVIGHVVGSSTFGLCVYRRNA